MAITEGMLRVLAFIEQYYFTHEVPPTHDQIVDNVPVSRNTVERYFSDVDFLKQFEDRGIPTSANQELSSEQILVINSILNLADRRSQRKKLSDAGVSPKQWQGWLKQNKVKAYIAVQAEKALTDAIPDAHMALVENVQSGDLGSIKLLYEMTGRFKSGSENVNLPFLLQRIISIIQTHVTDSNTLLGISRDFESLLSGIDTDRNPNQVIPSTPVARPLPRELTL